MPMTSPYEIIGSPTQANGWQAVFAKWKRRGEQLHPLKLQDCKCLPVVCWVTFRSKQQDSAQEGVGGLVLQVKGKTAPLVLADGLEDFLGYLREDEDLEQFLKARYDAHFADA